MYRKITTATCLVIALAVNSANAGFTPVGPDGPSTLEIINNLYGGGFTGTQWGGLSYTNGSGITLTRIHDTGALSDQIWSFNSGTLNSVARYGGNDSAGLVFGYHDTLGSTSSTSLFTVSGSGYSVAGSGSASAGSVVGFSAEAGSGTFSSNPAFNPLMMDHMISYEITGLGGGTQWLLLWELQGSQLTTTGAGATRICGSDRDFNDFVAQISLQGGGMNVIPAPAAALLAAIGLSAFAVRRRRA